MICLVGIKDPLRDGVQNAIQTLKLGGIRTVMVTGDNIDTAVAISKEAGIIPKDTKDEDLPNCAIEGSKLRELSDEELDKLLKTLCTVARCQPTDKLRVVKRFQHNG